jgi:hypothetical protein
MTLIRKKIPKSGYVLLAICVVVIIALPIVHFTGVYPLDFLGDWAISAAMVGTTSGWIAGSLAVGCGLIGFAVCYLGKDYLIGMEGNNLTVSNSNNQYQPLGTTSAPIVNSGTAVNE